MPGPYKTEQAALARVEALKNRGIWPGVRKICTHYGCPSRNCRDWPHHADWRWTLLHDPGDAPGDGP